jgi:Spy/CpxP family protein refolding chaperone
VRHIAHEENTRRELMASAKGETKMHPAMVSWWRARQGGDCGDWAAASCGPGAGPRGWGGGGGGWGGGEGPGGGGDGDGFGSGFGVRRPLRFLAYKLELDERQVAELARILDELKTERAQAEVDRRRTLSAFADAVGGEAFDQARAKEAADLRVASAERLRDAVTKALARIHALLDNDQRQRLAYLIRTGTLAL